MPPTEFPAAPSPRECARLAELRSYEVLDTASEPVFDAITNLAAYICGTPIALISLVDERRLWFKARTGLDAAEVPRTFGLCCDALEADDLFMVRDTHHDPRCKNHDLVTGPPHIRFYAAAPLRNPGGHALGTLCVIDHRPRTLNAQQLESLRGLARQVVTQLELQRTVAALKRTAAAGEKMKKALLESEERFLQFMNNGPAGAFIKDDEGRYVYVNEPLARRFEKPVQEWLGKSDAEIFGAAPVGIIEHDLQVLDGEKPLTVEEVVATPGGQTQYWLSHKFLLHDGERKQVGGLAFDITGRKRAEHERERLVTDLQQALAQVKTLSGFLPICASCKNIRTDQGYWQQIESYLAEHSELEFTHGICPICVEKFYPDFATRRRAQPPAPPQP